MPMLAMQAQKGAEKGMADAITGTWSGDWGPNAGDRNTVNVDLKLEGNKITGVVHSVNFKRADVELKNSTFDAKTGMVHLEADAAGRGGTTHFVIDGKLAGGKMSGSWNHDSTKGDFSLMKK